MNQNEELINKFYTSFQNKNAAGMNECYSDLVRFQDPVFDVLEGWKARAMWQMLVERATDLQITFNSVVAGPDTGSAHWEAIYKFGKTGNTVHNKIEAAFEFQNGKIIKHTDTFSLWRWAGMALGMKGSLLGWTPMVQSAIKKEAQGGLELYIKRKRLGPK
jgi:ketosteroid isomerase-like protein